MKLLKIIIKKHIGMLKETKYGNTTSKGIDEEVDCRKHIAFRAASGQEKC